MKNAEDFSTNPRIKSDDDKSLNNETIQQFVTEYGAEQAIGYIKAVRHFAMELEYAVFDLSTDTVIDERPLRRIRNNAYKLLLHKENFLKLYTIKHVIELHQKPE